MPPHRLSLAEALQDVERQFDLTTDDLHAILKRFRQQMELGLAENGQDMAMIPSFGGSPIGKGGRWERCLPMPLLAVTGVPDGTEKGTYLALDLGGTNL